VKLTDAELTEIRARNDALWNGDDQRIYLYEAAKDRKALLVHIAFLEEYADRDEVSYLQVCLERDALVKRIEALEAVTGKSALDMMVDNAALEARIAELKAALRYAKEVIKKWHNMGEDDAQRMVQVWEIYDRASPVMKRINAALEGSPSDADKYRNQS
jgi:NAD(P)-dependent dehydrogenase (short-subunit alcohol dehydrogenase family)